MNKLTIGNDFDFKNLLPYIIEAYTSVYGNKYQSVISDKINKAVIIPYYDTEGIIDYISYIERCKKREYSIKFLEEIGIEVDDNAKNNYSRLLEEKYTKILECFINQYSCFDDDKLSPIKSFNSDCESKELIKNKLKIINYLLGKEQQKITEENLSQFQETDEYLVILDKVNEYSKIYEDLTIQYKDWRKKLLQLDKYIDKEEVRKQEILKVNKMELLDQIYDILPKSVKECISNKSKEEQSNIIFGILNIERKTLIEYFSNENIEQLKSPNVTLSEKFVIVFKQSTYLEKLGITIPNKEILKCSKEDIENYLLFLNQDSIKKYIPSNDMIQYISNIREIKKEEALEKYYVTRQDYIDIIERFNNSPENYDYIYKIIKNKKICITGAEYDNIDNKFISLMFFTIRENEGGYLSAEFIHECGHIIDNSTVGCGFDRNDNNDQNIYDNNYRKYEKFNEVLNDIFTIEVINYLQKQKIYLIEPEQYTVLDISSLNTALITKKILYPLLQKFRDQVINAKISSNHNEIIKYIGKENFEELVDVVNKVDYLSRNGVVGKIKTNRNDSDVLEYYEQIKRVAKVYENIDSYYEDNFQKCKKCMMKKIY